MDQSYIKSSLLIPSQLPQYIRDDPDYETFVLFLQAYYEWMEQNNNVLYETKHVLSNLDIDSSSEEFLNYFSNEFLQYFPEDLFINKTEAIKIARQLYQAKGVPSSFKFLFRILFNSDVEYHINRDMVLRASDGIWYIPKSIRVDSLDANFLNIDNYRIIGETSKTIATVENSTLSGNKIEIFISNITRLFQSGEYIRVVDNNNQDVLFDGEILRGKIVGQISKITINPNHRGLLYDVNDPVILSGGLATANGIGAIAKVKSVTTGSIENAVVLTGGYGYTESPNTTISVSNAPTAEIIVGSLNPAANVTSNVTLFPLDTLNSLTSTGIGLIKDITLGSSNYHFPSKSNANLNSTLSETLTFNQFYAYPISTVILLNGGSGLSQVPIATALSRRKDSSVDTANSFAYLTNIGMLGPIQISNGGLGYQLNDTIVFSGGSGYGAYANVTNVSSSGAITAIQYVNGPQKFPLGGMGYRNNALPTLSINSANNFASNASIYIPSILGEGATFELSIGRIGSINTIEIVDPGEDYIDAPTVSLKVQDIVVANVSLFDLPQKGDIVYQGESIELATYIASVNSISILENNANPENSLFNLRVYDYISKIGVQKPLASNGTIKLANTNVNMIMANTAYSAAYDETGVRIYGDGKAKANASFLNGLVISEGMYLSEQGHPSSYNVLQSDIYNNFTYQITLEKEIEKYRSILLGLLHPSGMKVIGRYAIRSDKQHFETHAVESYFVGKTLPSYTGYIASDVTMISDFDNMSNNIITFGNLAGANIANFIFENTSYIQITTNRDQNVYSKVISVDYSANSITIKDNVWLTFANVATITANANSNVINILTVTNSYDIINNGGYSNTSYPIIDIIKPGDIIKIANNDTKVVASLDYVNDKIYLTSDLSSNANSYLSVKRTLSANDGNIIIYGPVGIEYTPELTTEDGMSITTEDDKILILG